MSSRTAGSARLEVARTIRQARIARDLTQVELARALGVTQSAVGQWESGRTRPDPSHFQAISRVLGVPVSALVGAGEGDAHFSSDVLRLAVKMSMLDGSERAAIEAALDGMLSYRRGAGD